MDRAQVQGLGPLFKIQLKIQNTGRKALLDVPVTFGYKHELYMMPEPHLHIPVLIPGLLYHYEVHVHSVHENGAAGIIRIYVCNKV